ncbi:MAG: energy transducer TonB [Steroidobacteraceae bacterium]
MAAHAGCEIDPTRFSTPLVSKSPLTDAGLAARNKYFVDQCARANGELLDTSDPTLKGRLLPPSKPVFPKREDDNYSVWARRQGIEGEAIVASVLEPDGTVRDAVVIQSAGNKMLDEGALKLHRTLRYEVPATLDGKPVRVLTYDVVRFSVGKKYPKN